ncbi:hypothetical protein BBP40_008754 [Aspergillus hancockii]|nr:hypothetical protein BBP40_008754 [Aspergillus hancockii]
MATPNEVYIAVIGAGGVGNCFLQQLAYLQKTRSSPHLCLCYIGIIGKALHHSDYSEIEINTALTTLDSRGQAPPSIPWIIDYLAAASSKSHIFHESSVGAGLPILSTLKKLIATGDEITRIQDVFSGTISFLFNSFAPTEGKGEKWSVAVRKVKQLGYTELDPRDDLNGLDIARKLTILGRLAGLHNESPTSFPVQNLIPEQLQGVESGEEFLERLLEFDDPMEEHKATAERNGKFVRFVGSIDMASREVKVGMESFDRAHPIAALQESDNIISFYTKRYGENPLIVQGAGAGGEVTAMGVSSDLLKVLSHIAW